MLGQYQSMFFNDNDSESQILRSLLILIKLYFAYNILSQWGSLEQHPVLPFLTPVSWH